MSRTYRHRSFARAIWCGLLVAGFVLTQAGCEQQPSNVNVNANAPQRRPEASLPKSVGDSGERTFTVDPGDEGNGFDYYFATFCELGLTTDALCTASPPPSPEKKKTLVEARNLDLTQALQFLGYDGLAAREWEDTASADLMSRFPGDVLSSAFFAPKITDVSKTVGDAPDPNLNIGWRKLIRLKARAGSPALSKGVGAGFLLFNKFQGPHDSNPFRPADAVNESKATQLILVRGDGSGLKRPVYFFVFGPLSGGSKLITFILASFDERITNASPLDNRYHVPHACAQCHGGKITDINNDDQYKPLKLNYLDTDHWFDRLDDDFAVVKGMPFPVLFDGDKDEASPKFAAAFDVIRQLNTEIRAQNAKVEPPSTAVPSFQLRAVDKWLQLHATSSSHQNVFARALPNPTGTPWSATATPDKDLLPLLNQYCFRCHSSLIYSVFDRPAVAGRRGSILGRLHKTPVADKARMPQDRDLDCAQKWRDDKQRMHTLVCGLNSNLPCPTPSPPINPCPTPSATPTPP
jgi:hypothetical protein